MSHAANAQRVAPDAYPAALADDARPRELWCEGAWPPASTAIAIVGSREPLEAAERFARELAIELAGGGLTIVSGGARGIDAAAHQGALVAGGRTVAVLPTGPAHVYPAEHAELYRRIASSGGTLVWPFPHDAKALPGAFFARNRVLVALAAAVVVVQAGVRSGALNAAAHARALRRPVFAMAGPPWQVELLGSTGLLAQGAHAIGGMRSLVKALVALVLAPRGAQLALPAPGPTPLPVAVASPQWASLREACARGARTRDALTMATGLAPGPLARLLLEMELAGIVREDEAGVRLL